MIPHPLLRPGPLPDVRLAWVNLDDPPEPFAALEGWLSPAERERAARFHFEVDRRRFVAAHGMLRSLLGHQLGLRPAELSIEADHYGKPRLGAHLGSDLRFNVSHAAGRALYGLMSGKEIGVDAEDVRPLKDMEALAREVFSYGELAEWISVPIERRVDAFFCGWTRKEAFMKALGRGLNFPLSAFDVSLAPDRPARLLWVEPESGPASRWSMAAWSPEAGFVAALVIDSGSAPRGWSPEAAAEESPEDPQDS
jgi:4'-phosphopantetheinyl transferase